LKPQGKSFFVRRQYDGGMGGPIRFSDQNGIKPLFDGFPEVGCGSRIGHIEMWWKAFSDVSIVSKRYRRQELSEWAFSGRMADVASESATLKPRETDR